MRNNLNSVIIEGTATAVSVYDDSVSFNISVVRYYRELGEVMKEVSVLTIVAYGKLAECMKDAIEVGREYRVVGRLRSYQYVSSPYPMVDIVAEHIEAKPDEKSE